MLRVTDDHVELQRTDGSLIVLRINAPLFQRLQARRLLLILLFDPNLVEAGIIDRGKHVGIPRLSALRTQGAAVQLQEPSDSSAATMYERTTFGFIAKRLTFSASPS